MRANEPIDLGGVEAQHVKLLIHSNWGGIIPQFSVSEVKFSYIPVKAREPQPDNGTTGVDPDIVLGWRTGRKAVSHTLTLSTDPETVVETSDNTYDTTALDLQLGESYSWVITEVNEAATPSVWEGDVWTFTIAEPLVFDDMESYQDKKTLSIWATWRTERNSEPTIQPTDRLWEPIPAERFQTGHGSWSRSVPAHLV